MNANTRKRISLVLVLAMALTLVVGSFAFFTDRENKSATATAGNIDLVFTDLSNFDEHKVDDTQTNGYTNGKVWVDGKLIKAGDVMNPGDNFDMGYKVANTGSKSIDVKQQIVLTSSVALTDGTEEYKIVFNGITVNPEKSDDDLTLTYELPQIVLSGSVEMDGTSNEQEYDLYMAFDRMAKNKFMDSTVTVKLDIQAKQHRNTTADDWKAWTSYTTEVEQIVKTDAPEAQG